MLKFLRRCFGKPEKLKVRLNNRSVSIEYSDGEKIVPIEDIIRIDAFARDDITYDTIGFLLATTGAEYPFTEEWDGYPDIMIKLGTRLGFDGDKMVLDIVTRQSRNAFSEWNSTVWQREQ
jgi:hypothetical protein